MMSRIFSTTCFRYTGIGIEPVSTRYSFRSHRQPGYPLICSAAVFQTRIVSFGIKDADPDLRVVDDALLELQEGADLLLCPFLFRNVPDSADKRFEGPVRIRTGTVVMMVSITVPSFFLEQNGIFFDIALPFNVSGERSPFFRMCIDRVDRDQRHFLPAFKPEHFH